MINTDGKTNNKCKQGAIRDLNPCKADPLKFSYSTWQMFQGYLVRGKHTITQFYKIFKPTYNEEGIVAPLSSSCTKLTMKSFFPANPRSYL